MVLLLLFLYNLVHKCLLFDGITIQLKMMDYLKFITLGIVFLVGIAQSKTVPGQPVSPALKQYINNEVKRIEKMFTDKVDEIMETTRNENARLKRENNFLIKNMCKERRKSYKQISDLKNELKDTGKRFIREMKAFKDLTVTGLLEKTREIHALKDKIRFVKLASELPSGQVKRIYRVGDNSDQEKSDNSEITLRDLGSPSNLVRVAQKDESGGSWNTEPSFNGPCDTCNDKYSM